MEGYFIICKMRLSDKTMTIVFGLAKRQNILFASKSLHLAMRHNIPSPFSLALFLSLITAVAAAIFTRPTSTPIGTYLPLLASYWETGFWELLEFSMQMMLILILGHALALSVWANAAFERLVALPKNGIQAVLLVGSLSMLFALINWGFGLIGGALLARKMGERAQHMGMPVNYPLVVAAAYSSMLVWHGGLSGSAPLKVAENNHFLVDKTGIIPVSETLFSTLNASATGGALLLISVLLWFLAKKSTKRQLLPSIPTPSTQLQGESRASKSIDDKHWFGRAFGLLIVLVFLSKSWRNHTEPLALLNLNYINGMLFGLGMLAHGSVNRFVKAVEEAIKDGTGILLQFPLYAGIMGMVKYSGLMTWLTEGMLTWANPDNFGVITLLSAGFVNLFVPSGGGQWAVQGPLVIDVALQLGVPLPKAVMALAYGDQLTNMLQPFWALPLLAITGAKAGEIFRYTALLCLAGLLIFAAVLWWM